MNPSTPKTKNKTKIGIYGGSFNPVHFGHLNLAIEVFEKKELDVILFCPAYLNPHKNKEEIAEGIHRINMLKLALEEFSNFSCCEIEFKRSPPSFTIDTIYDLKKEASETSNADFHLILGYDAAITLPTWRDVHELITLAPPYIGIRTLKKTPQQEISDPIISKAIQEGLIETKILDISSTEIRERIKEHKPISHLVPAKVIDYIYSNKLYLK